MYVKPSNPLDSVYCNKYAYISSFTVETRIEENPLENKWAIKINNISFFNEVHNNNNNRKSSPSSKSNRKWIPENSEMFLNVQEMGFTEELNSESSVVDIMGRGVKGVWTPKLQIELMRIIMVYIPLSLAHTLSLLHTHTLSLYISLSFSLSLSL